MSDFSPSVSNALDGSRLKPKLAKSRWEVSKEMFMESDGGRHVPWEDMRPIKRFENVVYIIIKLAALCLVIFIFICTLGLLADSFKLIGGRGIGKAVKTSHFIQNPIPASILGMVLTLVLQSSSTLISILVGMIAGGLITVHEAIPIMMGSEIGASFINAIISLGQSGNRDQFRRAFAAATMNDVFNFLCYIVILPLEIAFGIIESVSSVFVEPLTGAKHGGFQTLNALTDPLLNKIIQLDEEALKEVTTNPNRTVVDNDSFILRCVDQETQETIKFCQYEHLFASCAWSDLTIGIVLLAISLFFLIACLIGVVQLLNSLLAGQIAVLVRRLMDCEFPSPFRWLTNYVVMLVGCVIVMIVQASGVFRTALTPLVGIGVVTLERLYPLLLGANVGTTFTGVLAALSADPRKLRETMQIALCQTVYNILGILLFYPVPQLRRIPINLAKILGDTTAKFRWFAFVYIFTVFFFMPITLIAISFLPTLIMRTIIASFIAFIAVMIIINRLQGKCPGILPPLIRNWEFLPKQLHSLSYYDRFICHYGCRIPFVRRFFDSVKQDDDVKMEKIEKRASIKAKKSNAASMISTQRIEMNFRKSGHRTSSVHPAPPLPNPVA